MGQARGSDHEHERQQDEIKLGHVGKRSDRQVSYADILLNICNTL